jgi:hypothetical protein
VRPTSKSSNLPTVTNYRMMNHPTVHFHRILAGWNMKVGIEEGMGGETCYNNT